MLEGNKAHYGLCENDELRTSLMLALVFSVLSIVGMVSPAQEIDVIREFNLYVNAKRQTSEFKLRISQNGKWADKNTSEN